MVIKSFLGETVAAALKQIRSDLGPKAVVLKTRSLNASESGVGRRMVEITACLERPTIGALEASFAEETPAKAQPLQWREPHSESNMNVTSRIGRETTEVASKESAMTNDISGVSNAQNQDVLHRKTEDGNETLEQKYSRQIDTEEFARRLEEKLDVILDRQLRPLSVANSNDYSQDVSKIGQALLEQDIPDRHVRPLLIRVSDRMTSEKSSNSHDIAEQELIEQFSERCYPTFPLRKGDSAVFIGPAGSGKTSVLGKVAVKLLFKEKIKTRLATLDDFRVGAQEEIAGYSEALGATMFDVNADIRKNSFKKQAPDEIVLIDCHSNVNDQGQFSRLQDRIRKVEPTHVFLVISALTRSADLARLMRRFTALNPTHLIVTHTDLTDTVGGIYTALKETGLPLVACADAPGSVGSLKAPDPGLLARLALGDTSKKGAFA